jgi:imidazolonepropionase-like amidohydrolase
VAAVCEVARSRGKMIAAHCRSPESVKMALRNGVDVLYHCSLSDAEALDMLEQHKDRIFVAPALGIMYTTAVGEGSGYGIDKNHAVAIFFQRELKMCIENMKKLKKRGVRILPGGDYGFAWNPIGTNARDIEHFVKLLDFSPMDAIVSATRLGGQIMQMGNELGQIKPGYLADLLLVDGNPLADVSILRDKKRLLAIMKDGSFHKAPTKAAKAAQVAAE